MKRYFIVFYNGQLERGNIVGQINMEAETGYLSRARAQEIIVEYNPSLINVVITGIIELSKEDYNDWIS